MLVSQALRASAYRRPSPAATRACSCGSAEISSMKPDRVHMATMLVADRWAGNELPVVAKQVPDRSYASPMPRRPTIYDVAREAGVAASTVSRAYSRPGRVKIETARLIFETAERLGYRAGPASASSAGPRTTTHAIGLVVADVTNPFYGEIIKGAYAAARDAGYLLILSHTDESAHVERATIEQELTHVDGVVIASSRMSDSALRMMAKQKSVVLLNRTIPEVSCVVTDNGRGAQLAAEHLGRLGHEGSCYLAGPEASWSDGMRWRGLREAGAALSMDVRRTGPTSPPSSPATGRPGRSREPRPRQWSPTTTSWRSDS